MLDKALTVVTGSTIVRKILLVSAKRQFILSRFVSHLITVIKPFQIMEVLVRCWLECVCKYDSREVSERLRCSLPTLLHL